MAVQEGNEKEQVIKELEKQIRLTESVNSGWVYLTIEKAKKALELLDEQESEVKLSNDCGNYVCSNCGVFIKDEIDYIMDKPIQYCPSCGRKVKLDAVD